MTSTAIELHQQPLKSEPGLPSLQTRKKLAVCVRNACKSYGSKKHPTVVLDDLNMTVPKGSIYGMLGASGCGKTTLLGCILGRNRLNSGDIWVLDEKVGSGRHNEALNGKIGYMPQELCLHGEFTIKETLKYFGWLDNMSDEQIDVRASFLINLLMLPDENRLVKTLSGGQKRRVSLAAAFIHEPELLILDEPTCGVDPLLRQIIWDYLVDITKTGNVTVIITTHYIDETKQAHLIGLMRGGYFLTEENPHALLEKFGTDTLEEVFLKLSVMQNSGKRRRSSISETVINTVPAGIVNPAAVVDVDEHCGKITGEFGDTVRPRSRRVSVTLAGDNIDPYLSDLPNKPKNSAKMSDHFHIFKMHHMKALIVMNYLWMIRNWAVMSFLIILPFVQMGLFCGAIGHDPTNLPVAVVNYETNNDASCDGLVVCNGTRLSCNYMKYLEKRALTLIYYESEDDAIRSVMTGKTYASIIVKQNYTEALQNRIDDWRESDDWDIEAAEIDVIRDLTSKDIANYLKVYLYQSFQSFFEDYLASCDINPKSLGIPIKWLDPIYGVVYPNFTDFANPGMILTITFFLAVALTAGAMLIQRNEGSLERALILGVTPIELLGAHVVGQFVIMVIQMILVMICTFAFFQMVLSGSLFLVIILTTLTGFCGMCFGFAISCVVDSERMATYAAMGSFFPLMMLSGIIWPIEAMHYALQYISFFLPLTKATESMRSILQRGWGISEQVVYMGFISILMWIIIFLGTSIIFMRFKKG